MLERVRLKDYLKIVQICKEWSKKYVGIFLVNLFVGILIYFMLISENLLNDVDGIWHTSNFIAGDWEISLGRGLCRYFDKLRFGVVSVPLNTVLTLCLFAMGNVFLVDIFSNTNRFLNIVSSLILIVNPVVCHTLTYSYTAFNYGVAYLCSVLAAYLICKGKGWCSLIMGAGVLAISMANYQAYFGVTCTLLVLYFIQILLSDCDLKRSWYFGGRSVVFVGAGGVLYLLLVKILLFRADITLASYKGASGVSLSGMIKKLPESILNCYQQFYKITFENGMYNKSFGGQLIICGITMLLLFVVICHMVFLVRNKQWGRAILLLICILLMPMAMNGVLLLAVGQSVTGLMAFGIVVGITMLNQVLIAGLENRIRICACIAISFCLSILLWCNGLSVSNDQLALKEGKTAVITLTNRIMNKLDTEGYMYSAESPYTICLVGRPAESSLFYQSTAYNMSNGYARFGCFSTEAGNYRRTWSGVLNDYCGTWLNLAGDDIYNEVRSSDWIKDMPCFPLEGSVIEENGIVVVKISNLY